MNDLLSYLSDLFIKRTIKSVIIIFLVFSTNAQAVEQQFDKETTVFNQTFSWQAMLGLSAFSVNTPLKGVEQHDPLNFLNVSIMIDAYYKGFFIQSDHRRSIGLTQGAEIGYQLHVDENWAIDIITRNYITGFNPEELIEENEKDIPTLNGLKEREFGSAFAIRYSHFIDEAIFSIDFAKLHPGSEVDGWLIDTYYNELHIYKNWDIYIGGSLTYYSDQVMDYYYGINAEEANAFRALYDPDPGFKATVEIYSQYPISKNWSFNAGITQTYYSKNIKNSPIVDKQHLTQFLFGVIYVF